MAKKDNSAPKVNRERLARQREARSRSARATQAMISNPIQNRSSPSMRVLPGVSIRDISVRRRNAVGAVRYVADRGLAVGGLLGILFILLLTANIIGHFTGTPDRTVMGFLTSMQSSSMPQISLDWLNWSATNIVGDWGIFEFLRVFLNGFVDLINTVAFIGTSLINAVVWVLWFVKWVLFGV